MKSNRYSEYNKMNTEVLVFVTIGAAIALVGWSPCFGQVLQIHAAATYTKYLNGTMNITYDNGTTVTPPPTSELYKEHNHESQELELGNSTWTMYNSTSGSISKMTFHSSVVDGMHFWRWIRELNGHTYKGYFVPTLNLSNPYDYPDLCTPAPYPAADNCVQLQVIKAEQDHIEFKDQHGGMIHLMK